MDRGAVQSVDGGAASYLTDSRNCDNSGSDGPSDCEARFAMEYGLERRYVRAAEHAYLDQEMDELGILAAPASYSRVVRKDYAGLVDTDFSIV
jgi:hypothetical protein